jgi:hypothetical protein
MQAARDAAASRITTGYDNEVAAFPLEAVAKAALSDEDTSTRTKGTATQRMAAVCLAMWHRSVMAGTPLRTHDGFWRLNGKSGTQYFLEKTRNAFIAEVLKEIGVQVWSGVDAKGEALSADEIMNAKAFYKARQTLAGRCLDYAIDLCCAGGDDTVRLTPGYVLKGFDVKSGTFAISPKSILMDNQTPMSNLLVLMGPAGKTRAALVKVTNGARVVDGDVFIALDGTWYSASTSGKTKPDAIQANIERVREVADSKRLHIEKVTTIDPKTGRKTTTVVKTLIAEHKQRQSRKQDTAPVAPVAPGRPENTPTPPGDKSIGLKESMRTALTAVKAIMTEPVAARTGKPEDYFWTNDPDRALIQSTIDALMKYKLTAENFERETLAQRAQNKSAA